MSVAAEAQLYYRLPVGLLTFGADVVSEDRVRPVDGIEQGVLVEGLRVLCSHGADAEQTARNVSSFKRP